MNPPRWVISYIFYSLWVELMDASQLTFIIASHFIQVTSLVALCVSASLEIPVLLGERKDVRYTSLSGGTLGNCLLLIENVLGLFVRTSPCRGRMLFRVSTVFSLQLAHLPRVVSVGRPGMPLVHCLR